MTHHSLITLVAVAITLQATPVFASSPNSRSFRLNYGATLTGLPRDVKVRVWLPVPRSDRFQSVTRLTTLLPGEPSISREPKYGNQVLYFEAQSPESGELCFQTPYRITRKEVRALTGSETAKLDSTQRQLFLSANSLVPLEGKPNEVLNGLSLPHDPLALGRLLYNRVDKHVRYDKSQPGYGNGDVLWVCDSRFGNCTDFHSLFISLSRSQGIPARFEIGFSLPPQHGQGKIGGYHCWAYFFVDDLGWIPVDISEADKHPEMKEYYFGNLTENRVVFSTGRDIELVPRQPRKPLNYFIYPYVEVQGKPLPPEQIKLAFSYLDQP